ncbi:hypothetical protein SLS60_005688 [Paraconiothyrium brasiliense]|uniref:Uncharacterized protein n=1 Tax=Paraconiothyrium brasiliense TaxID=300254 RepID=A0ABR3RI27_9PLEO
MHMPITAHAAAHPPSPAEQPRLPTARPETSAQEMAAMFAAYSDLPDAPARKRRSTKAPQTSIVHEALINAHPQCRRRTTDGLQRTKSVHLALERVPHEYHIHNVVLQIHAPTTRIAQAMLNLDMQRNSVEWAYPANPSSYDTFRARVTVGRLRAWLLRIDGMLEGFDTGTDREGVLGTLEWSIKEALRNQGSGSEVAVEPEWFGTTGASSVEGCTDGLAGDQSVPSTCEKSAGPPTSPAFADPQTENTACLVQGPSDEFGGAELDNEAMLIDF